MSKAVLSGQRDRWLACRGRSCNMFITVSAAVINLVGGRKTNCKVFNCIFFNCNVYSLYIRMVKELKEESVL